jgi:hypothetical protein
MSLSREQECNCEPAGATTRYCHASRSHHPGIDPSKRISTLDGFCCPTGVQLCLRAGMNGRFNSASFPVCRRPEAVSDTRVRARAWHCELWELSVDPATRACPAQPVPIGGN